MSMALQHATSQLPPDAWAPIQPRAGSGGWSPTPPASWARREPFAGPTNRDQFAGPTANATPTPSAMGQVATTGKKSSKGVWLAIGAVVLVGGGVTAGVLLSRGGSSTPAAGSSAEAGSAASGSAVVIAAGSSAEASGSSAETPPAKDDDGDVDEPTAAALDGMLEGQLDSLPPEALAALPPDLRAAIKKYGGWSKVPKAERARIMKQVGKMVGSIDDVGNQINTALAGGSTPPTPTPPTPAPNPGGWFERHSIRPPGFDPKHANVEKFVAFAYEEAKKYVPDAEAWWIDADGVFPDGHADLTLPAFASDTGSITVRFISPSRAKPDPSIPRGVKQKTACAFYITIGPEGGEMYETGTDCKEKLVKRPRCSAAQVWKKVLALHPDGKDAVANIVYRDWNGKGAWDLDVRDEEHPISERVPDDC
jgi:hypothetical protein